MSNASPFPDYSSPLPEEAQAFEDLLASKTELSEDSRRQLRELRIGDLRQEARGLNKQLQTLAATIALSVESPDSLKEFLGTLELNAISREQGWRGVFSQIQSKCDDRMRERSVLIKYMQFLSARKHLVDDLVDKKAGLEETDVHTNVETYLALQARMRRRERDSSDESPGPDEFVRLSVGNTITLDMPAGGQLEILLAGHQFKLLMSGRVYLRDLKGVDYELQPGRNVVGRHPDCEVVLPGDLRNISRAHLLIERVDESMLNLTDLSSKGTFLPAEVVLSTLPDMD